jgi:hypothetical protein
MRRANRAASRAPAAVVPSPPACAARSLSSISAKKLSEGLLVIAARRVIVGDWTVASTRASAGARPALAAPLTEISRRASAESSRAAANEGGFDW